MKIRPVGAELFHADGRTVMTKLIVEFRMFANAHKKTANISLDNYFPYLSYMTQKIAVFWTVNHRLAVGYSYTDTTTSNKLNTGPEPELTSFLCNLGKLLLEQREATQIMVFLIFTVREYQISFPQHNTKE